jgi:hypothetical protein
MLSDPKVDVRRLKLMSGGSVSNREGGTRRPDKFTLILPEREQLYPSVGVNSFPNTPASGAGQNPIY